MTFLPKKTDADGYTTLYVSEYIFPDENLKI